MKAVLHESRRAPHPERQTRMTSVARRFAARLVPVVVLLVVPVRLLVTRYSPRSGFLALVQFGQEHQRARLPEVNALAPPTTSEIGYDGQFYAQVALDPLLTRPVLRTALDNPSYRARRIGLPLIAFVLGLGRPSWILHVYSVLNFAFWLLLLLLLDRSVGFRRSRDLLLAIALLWSTGSLASLGLALTDLPAAVLSTLALLAPVGPMSAAWIWAGAALIKETSVLSFLAARRGKSGSALTSALLQGLAMALPVVAWFIYVRIRMPSAQMAGSGNFSLPFLGVLAKLGDAGGGFVTALKCRVPVRDLAHAAIELIAPLSLSAQVGYLFIYPRPRDAAWRMGLGFALLFCILGTSVWVYQYGYCRVLLPLTFSANLLLHKYEVGRRFILWYSVANVGMFWACFTALM
jgi:hypothetical protein